MAKVLVGPGIHHRGLIRCNDVVSDGVASGDAPVPPVTQETGESDGRPAGSAALVLVGAATPLHPEPALFDAMIEGWRRQHAARRLSPAITRCRERTVRRFQEFTGAWP